MTMPRLDLLLDPLNQYLRQQNDLSLTPYQRLRQAPPKRPAEAPTGSPGWRQRQAMLDAVEQMLASQRLRDGSELPLARQHLLHGEPAAARRVRAADL